MIERSSGLFRFSQPTPKRRAHTGAMGLFVQRPEEPSEWAGLPGEPVRQRTRAEMLPDDEHPEASPAGLLGLVDALIASIEIPVPPAEGARD